MGGGSRGFIDDVLFTRIFSNPHLHPTLQAKKKKEVEVNLDAETKLFIGMISKSVDEYGLRELFSNFGEIKEIFVLRDKKGVSKGCAFLKFVKRDSASKAIKTLHQSVVMEVRGGRSAEPAKRGANNAIASGKNPTRTCFRTRRASTATTANILTHHHDRNLLRNSLRSSQGVNKKLIVKYADPKRGGKRDQKINALKMEAALMRSKMVEQLKSEVRPGRASKATN